MSQSQLISILGLILGLLLPHAAQSEAVGGKSLLPITDKFMSNLQIQLDQQNQRHDYRRQTAMVHDQDIVQSIHQQTTVDGDEVCESLPYSHLWNNLQNIARQQGLKSSSEDNDGLPQEWQQYFAGKPLQVCESVVLLEGEHSHRYWHVYLFENGQTKRAQRLLWLFETEW